VLVGAGHAHLETIRYARSFLRRGFGLTVIAPGAFWYSGLATGMLGGSYEPEEDQLDIARMVLRAGAVFVEDRVEAIDPKSRTIHRSEGAPLTYDVLSLNVGSEVPTWRIPGLTEHAIAVKPIRNLLRLREEVLQRVRAATVERRPRIVIVGGGATACEVAANLCALLERAGGRERASIGIVARGDRLMRTWPERASTTVADSLRRRGVSLDLNTDVVRVDPDGIVTEDERRVAFDVLVAATGLVPSRLVTATGLPADEEGGLLVDESLRSVADPHFFGGGDCIAMEGQELARVGVHGVRQAPILRHNLLAALEDRPEWAFRTFRPQNDVLQILNLGDGTGMAARGSLWWHGTLALSLKDWIDRRFLATYRP
jgi:NADH dehydrogenase FAD-containing subunit